jgi:transposase-like protein
MRRPRVRSVEGKEIPLQRYRMFQDDSRMQGSVVGRILRGVSTRNDAGVIENICEGYGIEKSSVSRQWKAATEEELRALMERRLDGLELALIMVEGIHFHEFTLVVALGMAFDGTKHVLGIWDGATENSTVVTALFEDLIDRGLSRERDYLFVVDGSKALRKAIVAVFGKNAAVQRCQVHKERNVLSHLPEQHQATIHRALRAAWGMKSYADGKKALEQLAAKLDDLSPGAAASLREGLEETLTIHRLEVHEELRPVLRSTNTIENIVARTRELCRNVKRWSTADMALRWASTMLLHAETRFHRVIGHGRMRALLEAIAALARKEAVA